MRRSPERLGGESAAREQVVGCEGVAMRHLLDVGARHHAHRAALDGALGEGHPRGHHVRLAEPPVGRVLVPGHEGRVPRFLDEEARAPAEEVGAEEVFHRVEDSRVPDQRVEPREEQVALVPQLAAERAAALALGRLEAGAIAGGLLGREHAGGEVEAVTTVLRHRCGGKGFHGVRSICRRASCQALRVFQGVSARTTNMVGSALMRAMPVSCSRV